jgi:hypothetical protein
MNTLFTNATLTPVKQFATDPGLLKCRGRPRSEVSLRALIQAESISNICCELRLGKEKYLNSY